MADENASSTPTGILHCLRMLTEEAAMLGLERTFTALKDALEVCHIEATARAASHNAIPTSLAVH